MKHYKAPNNSIHALSLEDIANGGEAMLPLGCVEITKEEADQITNPSHGVAVPSAVTMRQARLALLQANKLHQVNAAVNAMQGIQGEAARIEWYYSNEVRRNQPMTLLLAQAIGMTEQEMDQLFITAATL